MIVDNRHAIYVGWVLGRAMHHGLNVIVEVDDDGNYTDRLRLPTPSNGGPAIVLVVPYPPEDWSLMEAIAAEQLANEIAEMERLGE